MRNHDMPFLRKRASTNLDSLQTSVLSAFECTPCHSDLPNNVAKRRKRHHRGENSLKRTSVNSLCDDLCCISTDVGASRLSLLKQTLQKRSSASAQVAAHLFICDEVDTGPPLCSAVHLLQSRLIHLKDVQPASMIDRTILELRNPETCSCRGQQSGVQAVIRFVLHDSPSSERDMFVQHFLMVLFQNMETDSPIPQKEERFRLAEHVLSALRERENQQEEDMSKLHEWVRQASLPTRAAASEDQSKSNSDIWTAELSGLATGRSPWEYLTYGKAEKRALINLFKLLPPVTASRVYLECIHSVFRQTGVSSRLPPRANGRWSRVVILGHRVLDTTCFADADPGLRRGILSSLNGVLTATVTLNECHEMAVLLCLIRCVLVAGGSSERHLSSSKDLKEYEIWLRDFVGRNRGAALVTLLKTMEELIPLEPLNLLRVNHRLLSLKREHAGLASDYLLSLRSRISDLDPSRSERFMNSNRKDFEGIGSERNNPGRIEEEVIQFILDYSKLRKIPPSLARKMNFHRYYFRTRILTSLFNPSLGDKFREMPSNGQLMNASSFDDCRIEMIKDLAFNRKDRAITVAEANEAIASILAARHRPKAVKRSECLDENVGTSCVTESSSVQEICRAILEECQVVSNTSAAIGITTNAGALASINILVKKIEELWKSRGNPARGPELAAELLHGMTSALEETGKAVYPDIFGSLLDSTSDSVLRVYDAWWKSHGVGLLHAIRHLLESPTGAKIQKFLQYQLFALLCAGEACLTKEATISLAMFATGLAKLGGTVALMDILMISKRSTQGSCEEFLSSVISCLPLTRGDVVTTSLTFALHCVCLHVTLFDFSFPSGLEKQAVENGSAYLENHNVSFAASRAYRNMLDMLRWIIRHPWRLSAFPTREFRPFRVKMPGDAISVITFITRLLVSRKVAIPHDFTIEQYMHIEERCGWGRVGSVYEELRKREQAGIHPTRLLCQFALFLAKRRSSRWPSVTWMEQGMMRYAEETISCRSLDRSSHMTLWDAPRFLKRSINSDGTEVGHRVLDLYSRMRFCYFHGYSGADIEQHLATTLVPWYWPFSANLVDFLWDCLNKRCSQWEIDHNGIKDNFLLVSNFALYGSLRTDQIRDMTRQTGRDVITGTRSDDISSKRTELRKAMEDLSALDCGIDGNLRTQVVTRSQSRFLLPATLTKEFGCCVVLGLARKCQLLGRSSRAERVRVWIHQAATMVEEASLSNFLGASLSVASLLPFTRHAEEYIRHNQLTEITDTILVELLERHIILLGEGANPFQWTRRLLPGRVAYCGDIRKNILMWLGWHAGNNASQSKWSAECLPVDMCMGRLFQSVGYLCEESLCCVISNLGHDGLSKCLIPNILNACQRLTAYGCGNVELKLSKSSYERLLESKEDLMSEMKTVVIRLLTSARGTLDFFGDGAIAEAVINYPEFRDELISGVRARLQNHKNDQTN